MLKQLNLLKYNVIFSLQLVTKKASVEFTEAFLLG